MQNWRARLGRYVSFEWKIRWIGLAFFITILPVLLTSNRNLERVAAENDRIIENYSRAVTLAERLRYLEADETVFAQLYVLTANPEFLKNIDVKRNDFQSVAVKLQGVLLNPADSDTLRDILQSKSNHDAIADLGLEMRKNGMTLQQIHAVLGKRRRHPVEVEFGRLNVFASHMADELTTAKRRAQAATHGLIHTFTFSSLGTLVALALLAITVMRLLNQNALHESERAQLFDRMKSLARARKEAVEVVAHDLQNPLAALTLRMQMLQRKISMGQDGHFDVKQDVSRLVQSAGNMKNLIRNLLDHAKIESGMLALELTTSDVPELVNQVFEVLQPLAQEKSVSLVQKLDDRLLPLDLDPQYWKQALSNLIGNSLKFTPPGGRIEIAAHEVDGFAEITVSDTGNGIKEEELPFVFDRFWRSNVSGKGTGLGLAIVKGIVEAHHGHVSIASVPGMGTRVTMRFPIHQKKIAIRSAT